MEWHGLPLTTELQGVIYRRFVHYVLIKQVLIISKYCLSISFGTVARD